MNSNYFEHDNKGRPYSPYMSFNNKDFNFFAHYHEETEIIYVKHGNIMVTTDNTNILIKDEDILIIAPGKIHSIVSLGSSQNHIFKFYTPELIYSYNITAKICRNDDCYSLFKRIIDEISNEYKQKNIGYSIAVNALADTLFLNVVRILKCPKLTDNDKAKNRKNILILKKITDYCENHYTEKIDLDSISAACNYSRYYFSHIFREITSMNFPDFLSGFRVEKSKNMLYLGKSVSETAFECGFNNLRSFNRAFKKYTNTTPKTYMTSMTS